MYDLEYTPMVKCPKYGRFGNFTVYTDQVDLSQYWCMKPDTFQISGSLASPKQNFLQA